MHSSVSACLPVVPTHPHPPTHSVPLSFALPPSPVIAWQGSHPPGSSPIILMLFMELAAEPDTWAFRQERHTDVTLASGLNSPPGPRFGGLDPGGGGAELQGSKHPEPGLTI